MIEQNSRTKDEPYEERRSIACSIRKSLFNHSIRKLKKRKSILESNKTKTLIEEDGTLSTENGDSILLVEFDLNSNFKFIPYRTELNNLIANNFMINNHSSLTSLHSNLKQTKSISFINQLNEHLPELLLQRIAFCNEHSDLWRQQIKLAHDIIPKPPPLRLIRPTNHHLNNQLNTEQCRMKRTNSLAIPNHSNHNNNDCKRICLCERCQLKKINELKQNLDSKMPSMPSMDNISLRVTNEFNTLTNSKQSNSMIAQLLNR